MKRIFAAVTSAVLAAVLMTANLVNASGSVYNTSSPQDRIYYCIVKFADDPLAKYDYAKQNGVDEFIFTEEGQNVYNDLMKYHDDILLWISTCLGRSVERVYDYTAVYNGMSLALSDSEYSELCRDKDSMGIEEIYKVEPYNGAAESNTYSGVSNNASYADMTNKVLEQTGISSVDGDGSSMVISIIDSGFESSHKFLSTMPDGAEERLDPDFIDDISPFLSAASGSVSGYYQNGKIPFRFNYYAHSDDTSDISDAGVAHGTHVAGIAGGNGMAETDPTFDPKGVAPEAQLLLMSTGMSKACIMAAYNDSAYLGADVINASFGNDYLPAAAEPFTNESLVNLNAVGTMICTASGNSSKIKFPGESSLLNMDYSAGGTPDGVSAAFSVGSADNIVVEKKAITAGNENYIIMSKGDNDINEVFADQTIDMEIIPGMGTLDDFENIDVKGKIAVIKRGSIPFEEKALNAMINGAVGVIFCNNVEEDFSVNVVCQSLPSCILSLAEGERLMKSGATSVTFNSEQKLFTNMQSNMSSFSSWGFTENLVLKPDITAYGGCIVSSLPNGKYGIQSGTSMSSPQMAGMAALLKEYLKNNKEKYGIENDSDYPELMARLLMSTAVPVYNTEGSAPASPRVQGSGLANVENAMKTPVYLYTDSQEDNFRPKLSLGDNLEVNSGNISFSAEKFNFHVKNISDKKQTYKLSAELLMDSAEEGMLSFNVVPMIDSNIKFMFGMTETDTVTVDPGDDIIVDAELKLGTEDRNYISETFKNGAFVDGFIHLKNVDSAPDLNLPFTGYYGSWNKGDIFDSFIYDSPSRSIMGGSVLADSNSNFAGVNMIRNKAAGEIKADMPYYSPNGDNILDDVSMLLSFQRRCKNIKAELYKGNKNIYTQEFSPGVGYVNPSKHEEYRLDWSFEDATEDDLYTLRITAETPFSEKGSNKDIISQQFKIDLTPPTIHDCRNLIINGENYMLINTSDNIGVQGAVMNDGYDYNYCSKDNPTEHYAVLKMPDDNNVNAVVYDIAGNSKEVTEDVFTDNAYTLNYDDELYFSTNDQTFKKKIIMKDKSNKNVVYTIMCTPERAYKEGITEISVLMNNSEIVSVPVSVGLAGDADRNDITDLYDVIKVAKYLIWKGNPNGSFKNEFKDFEGSLGAYLADYDGNGSIDLYDAVGIAKTLIPSAK